MFGLFDILQVFVGPAFSVLYCDPHTPSPVILAASFTHSASILHFGTPVLKQTRIYLFGLHQTSSDLERNQYADKY